MNTVHPYVSYREDFLYRTRNMTIERRLELEAIAKNESADISRLSHQEREAVLVYRLSLENA